MAQLYARQMHNLKPACSINARMAYKKTKRYLSDLLVVNLPLLVENLHLLLVLGHLQEMDGN
jgi:hypothetical protein